MALFLVQHGISLAKDKDPEKGLSPEGVEDTKRIAQVAAAYKIPVASIVHSGKKRALQTAQVFHDTLKLQTGLVQMDGIKPMDPVGPFKEQISPDENVMVVGHMPFMERLVSFLICNDQDQKVYQFQNSGIVCLDCKDNNWFIKWTLNPNIS